MHLHSPATLQRHLRKLSDPPEGMVREEQGECLTLALRLDWGSQKKSERLTAVVGSCCYLPSVRADQITLLLHSRAEVGHLIKIKQKASLFLSYQIHDLLVVR